MGPGEHPSYVHQLQAIWATWLICLGVVRTPGSLRQQPASVFPLQGAQVQGLTEHLQQGTSLKLPFILLGDLKSA